MKNTYLILMLAFLLMISASFKQERKSFSVITYNVWNGLGNETQRKNTFAQWANAQKADVIAFQELNHFTQASFSAWAKTWGHKYAAILKEDGYPVGISSRYPIANVYKQVHGLHHGYLYAEIKGVSFLVLHLSPFSRVKRLEEANSIIQLLKEKKKHQRIIVLGDFNSLSPHDSTIYAGTGLRDSMYIQEEKHSHIRNLTDKKEIDYQVVRTFLQNGFYDGFHRADKKFTPSFPTLIFGNVAAGKKKKIDQLLFTKELKKSCIKVDVMQDAVTDTLSDHYPLKAVFTL